MLRYTRRWRSGTESKRLVLLARSNCAFHEGRVRGMNDMQLDRANRDRRGVAWIARRHFGRTALELFGCARARPLGGSLAEERRLRRQESVADRPDRLHRSRSDTPRVLLWCGGERSSE